MPKSIRSKINNGRLQTVYYNSVCSSWCGLTYCVCVSCLQVFSIVVFATITAEGYRNKQGSPETKCMFNENDSACNYGVGIGVIAFLACVAMLIIDANFPQISNAQQRKIIVMGDLVFSGESLFFHLVQTKETPPQNSMSCVSSHLSTSQTSPF